MKRLAFIYFIVILTSCAASRQTGNDKGWISLFDGKSFNGWVINENDSSFTIDSGAIRVFGRISHLFYDGPVMNHNFKNLNLKPV